MGKPESAKRTSQDSSKSEVKLDTTDVIGEMAKTFAIGASTKKQSSATPDKPVNQESDLSDAFVRGLQGSSAGLALRGGLPDKPTSDTFSESLAEVGGAMVGDLPLSIVGAAIGGLAGAPTGYGAAIVAGAGALALPTATKTVLSDAYEKGTPVTMSDWLTRTWSVFKETSKAAVVGGLTGGIGKYAGTAYGITGRALSDVAVPTVGQSAVEGRLPTAEEFGTNAAATLAMSLVPVVGKAVRKPKPLSKLSDVSETIDPPINVSETEPTVSSPVDNPGTRIVAGGDGTGGAATIAERPATIDRNVQDIWTITSKTVSPELAVLGRQRRAGVVVNLESPGAQDIASATIGAQLMFNQRRSDLHVMLDAHRSTLSEQEQRAVRGAIRELYDRTPEGIATAAAHAEEAPRVYAAAGDIIQWFSSIKTEVRDYMRVRLRRNLRPEEIEPFNQALDAATPEDSAAILGAAVTDPARLKGLTALIGKYRSVDFWGIDDFITNIELGSYKVLDDAGHVRAIRETRTAAREAYSELASAMPDQFTRSFDDLLDTEYSGSINPLVRRRGILRGEENVFKSIPVYGASIFKRILYEPLEARMNDVFTERPQEFPPNIRATLRAQIRDAKGVYTFADRVIDDISLSMGTRTGALQRTVGVATSVTAKLALGYRIGAAAVNTTSGYGKIWVKHGMRQITDAVGFMRTAEGKKFLAQEEGIGSLGQNVFIDESGKVTTTLKWYDPLKIFSMPEPGIRRLNLSVAYLEGLNSGMTDASAREYARRMLRLTNNTYNSAALAEMFRGSGSRLILQFKSYLARELEFMHTLTPTQFNRYVAYQLSTSGLRGGLILAKSLPVIGALGIWNTVEQAINDWKVSRGLPGLAGVDLAPSFSLQFPSRPEDAYGLVFSHMFNLYKDVVAPALGGEIGTKKAMGDYIAKLPLIARHWGNVLDSIVTPDGYVLGDRGEPLYKIESWRDKALLTLGVTTTDLSRRQVNQRTLLEEERKLERNRSIAIGRIVKRAIAPDSPDKQLADLVSKAVTGQKFADTELGEILGIWKTEGFVTKEIEEDFVKYGISEETIRAAIKAATLTPEERLERKLYLLRKLKDKK